MALLAFSQGGKWPFWLSPRQCMVIPVSDDAFEQFPREPGTTTQ